MPQEPKHSAIAVDQVSTSDATHHADEAALALDRLIRAISEDTDLPVTLRPGLRHEAEALYDRVNAFHTRLVDLTEHVAADAYQPPVRGIPAEELIPAEVAPVGDDGQCQEIA